MHVTTVLGFPVISSAFGADRWWRRQSMHCLAQPAEDKCTHIARVEDGMAIYHDICGMCTHTMLSQSQ